MHNTLKANTQKAGTDSKCRVIPSKRVWPRIHVCDNCDENKQKERPRAAGYESLPLCLFLMQFGLARRDLGFHERSLAFRFDLPMNALLGRVFAEPFAESTDTVNALQENTLPSNREGDGVEVCLSMNVLRDFIYKPTMIPLLSKGVDPAPRWERVDFALVAGLTLLNYQFVWFSQNARGYSWLVMVLKRVLAGEAGGAARARTALLLAIFLTVVLYAPVFEAVTKGLGGADGRVCAVFLFQVYFQFCHIAHAGRRARRV